MQLTLEIRQKHATATTVVVSEVRSTQIGASNRCDVCIPNDVSISDRHCVVEFDGSGWQIRDLNSQTGTQLNRNHLWAPERLQDGDEILVGQTKLIARINKSIANSPVMRSRSERDLGFTGQTPLARHASSVASISENAILNLTRQSQPLFAIFDAARDLKVLQLLEQSAEHHESLYAGVKGSELASAGPWLVEFPLESQLLKALVRNGWGQSWGVYLTCGLPFIEVRKHFRHFLLVPTEDGRRVYFRFYDPRVLRIFLPTCSPAQTKEFFGPVSSFLAEAVTSETLIRFTDVGGIVQSESIVLLEEPSHNEQVAVRTGARG